MLLLSSLHCSLNMSCLSAFTLLELFCLLSSVLFSAQGCPPHELKAILRFKSTLSDPAGMLNSWKGRECCGWNGVKCSITQEERHVSKLDLGGFELTSVSGKIDSSLFELKRLHYLDLRGNYFHGEIPPQLGKLSSLHHLYLESDASSCMYFSLHFKYFCNIDDMLTSSNLHWLANLSSIEYLSLRFVDVRDQSWGPIIGSLFHLKHLDLFSCFLSAPTIPNALVNLSSLTFLDLGVNSFSNIPTWIGELSSLTHLDLFANNMSGGIPNTIGNLTALEYLNLLNNALTGEIPPSLGHNHGSLSHLDLGLNKLEGTIPSSLSLLANLAFLDLCNNQLSGNIPVSFGNLHKLTEASLCHNQLSGSLPLSFAHLSSLTYLDVSNNNLNGTITQVFFQKYLKLKGLGLSDSGLSISISSTWIPSFQLEILLLKKCQIGGPIPSWISTQFSLVQLDLSDNQLTGNLPSWLWDIEEVLLSNNNLQGSFTPTSGSLSNLDLSMNQLSGCLPADIHVHLSSAEVLILADNKFQGQMPTSIANLRNLAFLDISNNSLTGNIPATLGNLTHLEALNLEKNYLEGEIPKEFGTLSYLQCLSVGKNGLQGILPSSLTNLSSLQELDVGENYLTGNIPNWIASFSNLHVLVMRSNNFGGNLLPEIGRMPKLQVLDLSSNSFSGAIPHSYLRLPAMQHSSADGRHLEIFSRGFTYSENMDQNIKGHELHYQYILSSFKSFDLSNNRLSGPLPPEIENLKGLMYFNLSMNSLSGAIPESLGNLVQLESLDFSLNNFSGQIPWQLGNLTYLAHLNLSYNNLCGRIPQGGGQMLTFDESSFIGNPNLWGCPLERNCSRPVAGARASPPPAVSVDEKREQRFEFPWYWMCFGLFVGVGFSGVVMVLVLKLGWRTKYFEVMERVIEATNLG